MIKAGEERRASHERPWQQPPQLLGLNATCRLPEEDGFFHPPRTESFRVFLLDSGCISVISQVVHWAQFHLWGLVQLCCWQPQRL